MAFYLSYFFLALPASAILRATGMKRGMALGLFVMAVGALIFGHFTTARIYGGALTGLFVIGAGLALLQTAANPYVSILGPISSAARRVAFMGICNKFAGLLAPIVFGRLVLSGLDDFAGQVKDAPTPEARDVLLDTFAAQVYLPYALMAVLLALLAVFILRSNLPDLQPATANANADPGADAKSIFAFPHLWLGVVGIFAYVGVEVMAADAIGIYGDSFGLPLDTTRLLTSYTLAAMLCGYLVGLAVIPRFISQESYLAVSAALGIALCIGACLTTGIVSVGFIAALGFANAMMWPAIFPLAIRGLGRHTESGSALLIMAVAGGAIMPWVFAHLKLHLDVQFAYASLAVPSYLFLLFFGLRGHRTA
jgi:glucose/galactose transporter